MASASTWFKDAILNHFFRGSSTASPATLYFALHTADPGPAGTGAEVSGGAYARIAISCNTTNWTAPADNGALRRIQNAVQQAFAAAPTAGWGTVTHWGLWTASTAGNLVVYGQLDASRQILAGDLAPALPVGLLAVDAG